MSPAATFRRTDRLKPLPLRSLTDDDGGGLLPAHRGAASERAREQATQLVQGALKVFSDTLRTSNDVEQLPCSMGQGASR